MKIKTSELIGPALNWTVATLQGYENLHRRELKGYEVPTFVLAMDRGGQGWVEFDDLDYDRDWSQGGPIIEREAIQLTPDEFTGTWTAYTTREGEPYEYTGPAPLIAAMRCYVASNFGDEVNIPEELA